LTRVILGWLLEAQALFSRLLEQQAQCCNQAQTQTGEILIFCDHAAVAMRLVARLPSAEFAFFHRSSTTGRIRYCEYLFLIKFHVHGENNATTQGVDKQNQ
jgi:hypothetical protein